VCVCVCVCARARLPWFVCVCAREREGVCYDIAFVYRRCVAWRRAVYHMLEIAGSQALVVLEPVSLEVGES